MEALRTGEVQPPFAPVDARPAECAAAAPDFGELDAEVGEEFFTGTRDHSAVLAEHDLLAQGERVGERDAEPAGDMVVAGARGAQLFAAVPARAITLRSVGGNASDLSRRCRC